MRMNIKKARKVCWYVLFGTALILGIPGFVIGTLLYIFVSILFSIITCFSVVDFLAVYNCAVRKVYKVFKDSITA